MYINNNSNYLAAYNVAASYQTTSASLNLSGSYLELTGGASFSSANAADGVDISQTAKELADRIKQLDVFSIIYPNSDARQKTKSLGDVENDFLSDFNSFSGAFGKMSAMMGLDSSSTFTMGLDGVGGVTVEGSDSGQASKLQNAFNGNSTMVARYAVMAARAALVDAGNTVDGFKDSYAGDPVAAIQDNIDALKERLLGFRTQASGGAMNYDFMRDYSVDIDYSSTTASYAVNGTEEAA